MNIPVGEDNKWTDLYFSDPVIKGQKYSNKIDGSFLILVYAQLLVIGSQVQNIPAITQINFSSPAGLFESESEHSTSNDNSDEQEETEDDVEDSQETKFDKELQGLRSKSAFFSSGVIDKSKNSPRANDDDDENFDNKAKNNIAERG